VQAKKNLNGGVFRRLVQLLLYAKKLVVLGRPLGSSRCTGLEQLAAQSYSHISKSRVLCLCRAVGGHDLPACPEGHACRIKGLGDGTDLVELEQQGVAGMHLDALLQALYVGDIKVISNYYGARQLRRKLGKAVIRLLLEGVFQGNNRVGLDQIDIVIDQLSGCEPVSIHGVAAFHVEAGSCRSLSPRHSRSHLERS
jgi:hypothetical protein